MKKYNWPLINIFINATANTTRRHHTIESITKALSNCDRPLKSHITWLINHEQEFQTPKFSISNINCTVQYINRKIHFSSHLKRPTDLLMYIHSGGLIDLDWFKNSLRYFSKNHHTQVMIPEYLIAANEFYHPLAGKKNKPSDIPDLIWANPFGSCYIARATLFKNKNSNYISFTESTTHSIYQRAAASQGLLVLTGCSYYFTTKENAYSSHKHLEPNEYGLTQNTSLLMAKLKCPEELPIDFHERKQRPCEAIQITKKMSLILDFYQKRSVIKLRQNHPLQIVPALRNPVVGYTPIFQKLRDRLINKNIQYVLILHQLRRGGAELEALYHIMGILRIKPNARIALIVCYPNDPDWSCHLPSNVDLIEFGRLTLPYLNDTQQSQLLALLMSAIKPKILHVKAADAGWKMLDRYAAQLKTHTELIASVYCINYLHGDEPESPAYRHLPQILPHLTYLFSDNKKILTHLKTSIGLSENKAVNLRFPTRTQRRDPNVRFKPQTPLLILWASRISKQKNLRLLYLVCKMYPEHQFHLYGEMSEFVPDIDALLSLKNVTFYGNFDSLESLDISNYDAFLYTSSWDGLPNIILEAGMLGLPIISTPVGGIPEILNSKNSYLAKKPNAIIQQIGALSRNPALARKRAFLLQKDILSKHSEQQFFNQLCDVLRPLL